MPWRPAFNVRIVLRVRPRSERGDRLYLEQQRLLDQSVDHQQRVRRVGAVAEHLRKLAQAVRHEARDVLGMDEIGRELDDVAPARAARLEGRQGAGEGQPALLVEAFGNRSVGVRAYLAGDEDELRRLDPRDLRVLAER